MTITAKVYFYSRDAFDHTDRLTNSSDGEFRSLAREVGSLDDKRNTDLVEWSVIHLWLRLIQLACSDELITEMIKVIEEQIWLYDWYDLWLFLSTDVSNKVVPPVCFALVSFSFGLIPYNEIK